MAFPSANVSLLSDALAKVRQSASDVRSSAQNLRTLTTTENTGASSILRFASELAGHRAILVANASAPGLGVYAQQQLNNGGLDIVAEYNTMLTQIDATRNWITANFPKDGSNYLLSHTFNGDGTQAERVFGSATLLGLRSALDALIGTIS